MSGRAQGPWRMVRRGPGDWEIHAGPEDEAHRLTLGTFRKMEDAELAALAPELLEAVDWARQTVHRAHHAGPLETCPKNTCAFANKLLAKAAGRLA